MRLQKRIARDVNVREKFVEIGTGKIDIDAMRIRRERGRRHIIEIDRRLAVENHIQRLLPDDARDDVRPRAQRRRARVQLGRGDASAKVGQEAAVARARHFRLHIG